MKRTSMALRQDNRVLARRAVAASAVPSLHCSRRDFAAGALGQGVLAKYKKSALPLVIFPVTAALYPTLGAATIPFDFAFAGLAAFHASVGVEHICCDYVKGIGQGGAKVVGMVFGAVIFAGCARVILQGEGMSGTVYRAFSGPMEK